uniref:Uncharacterized protein n=1 Tax=Arundo donax TaxID=35708 RepID=A0A0A8ZM70_ARUDO
MTPLVLTIAKIHHVMTQEQAQHIDLLL